MVQSVSTVTASTLSLFPPQTRCTHRTSRYANVTLGQPCQVENTPYIGYAGADEFIDIVSRGNCRVGMYCDSQQTVCVQAKQLTEGCSADKELVALIVIMGYLSLTAVT